jgi:hypothetical protein
MNNKISPDTFAKFAAKFSNANDGDLSAKSGKSKELKETAFDDSKLESKGQKPSTKDHKNI